MTLPRSAADVLSDHVLFEVESIDRLYCTLYVPQLQRAEGIAGFVRGHLGQPIAMGHAWPTLAVIPWERQVVKRFFRGIERRLDGPDPGPDPLLVFDKRR